MQNELDLAIEKINQKKFEEAINIYEKILESTPNHLDSNLNLGTVYFQTGNLEKASEFWNKAININPNIPEIHNNLATIYINRKDYAEAINYAKKAIEINPNFYLAHNNLGISYKGLKKLIDAKSCFIKTLELNPKYNIAHYNLGIIYYELNEIEKSELSYLKSIELNPNYIFAYINLLNLYEKINDNFKLEELLDKAQGIFKENASIKLFRGKLNYKQKKYEESINILQSINFYPSNKTREITRLNFLAKAQDKAKRFEEAFDNFHAANKLNMENNSKNYDKNKVLESISLRKDYFKSFNQNDWVKLNSDTPNPVFLIGFPRSGTTLLDTILRSHKDISVIEEKPIISNFIEHLNSKINNNIDHLKNLNDLEIFDLQKYYLDERNKYIQESKNLIIDKMPLNMIHTAEIIRFFPNAKFILAIRNPCDCVLSSFMQSFKLNDSMANLNNLDDSVHFYSKVMELWDVYEKQFKINFHQIKYEEIIINFESSISNLLNFLHLEWSNEINNFNKTAKNRGLIATPSYDQVSEPLYNSSINRWKNYENKFNNLLTKLDPWIKKYGY